MAEDVEAGRLSPKKITEATIQTYLYAPDLPDVDLFVRSSGEQRTSNFQLWQSAYAEMVFLDTLWPDFDRRSLWSAIDVYARRDRRYGGAVDVVSGGAPTASGEVAVVKPKPHYDPELMGDPDEADGGVFADDGLID